MSPVSRGTSRSTRALETGEAKLWLLLVGVNQYQDESLPPLRYSALDCQGLVEALAEATQSFPQKTAIAYHDFAAQAPTLSAVRGSIQQIVTDARSQDTILFYFSGHGVIEPNTQQPVLCLRDTQKDNLLATGLELQELLQKLDNCAARQQIIWLDACHSGGMTLRKAGDGEQRGRGSREAGGVGGARLQGGRGVEISPEVMVNPTPELVKVLGKRAAQSKGFYALLSCDRTQQSWEFPELGHGVFTYYLMRGLRGEAADSQGVIEADGLYKYVYHQTLQYIDKTNQQLRLINQQKRGKGESHLYSEYPLQTPKRIVEGFGELILGLKPERAGSQYPRQALVVKGLAGNQTTLALSKLLRGAGAFELKYLSRSGKTWAEVRDAIQTCLRSQNIGADELQSKSASIYSVGSSQEIATVLLYLRGRIEETEAGESWLVLGDGIRLSRSWLRQQLRNSQMTQQIIILDCPEASSLAHWVDDLQFGSERGQCLIAAAATASDPDQFAQALLETLQAADEQVGLPVAGWIAQLQVNLAGSAITPQIWLSGTHGVIEVLPGRVGTENPEGFDLGICPYMGLKAFGEEDAQYFYGREALTQKLINELSHRAFLAVVGASGSGKSSVVHAGLAAQLNPGKQLPGSEQWWIKSFRPGSHPLSALARRLVDAGTTKEKAHQQLQIEGLLYQGIEGLVCWLRSRPEPMVVLIVDQFEELFTLTGAEERQRFLEIIFGALEYAGDRFKLVITLRADFISSCLEIPQLAQHLQQSNVLVPPGLIEEDYRQVIIKPAEQVGLKVDSGLVEVLLQELDRDAGDLPLLEFVLEQLWEHRQAGQLTLQAYREQIGGLKGALERKAQAVYDSLDAKAQACAQWIFLMLTQLGESTEDTKRRILKSDLVVAKYPAPLVERTLQALIAAKLVVVNLEQGGVTGQSRGSAATPPESDELLLEAMKQEVTVEVAHEVLIRHWSTLRWWLEENRANLRVRRQVEQAAMLWKQSGKQPDFLLQGVRLGEAEDIYIKYTDELSEDVQKFIEACLEARQQQQLQAKRRLRQAQTAIAVISVLGIAAMGFGGLAYWQKQAAQVREIEALNSSSEALLLSNQQLEALISSVKAGKQLKQLMRFSNIIAPSNLAQTQATTASTLQQSVYNTQERNRLQGHTEKVNSVSFSPDGQLIASASDDGTIKIWSREGSLLHSLTGHTDRVTSVTFSPDGKTIASASADKTIKFWRTNGTLIKSLIGHNDWVNSVIFTPDGKTIASASRDQTVKLWRADGTIIKTFNGHSGWVNAVIFSPDGKTIASASEDKTIKLWSINGVLIRTISGHGDRVNSITFSPDSKTIASASGDKTVKLWSVTDGTAQTFDGHGDRINSVNFSPDGKTLVSASADGTLNFWSQDGSLLKTVNGQKAEVLSVSFSPNGKILASASADKTVRLWSADGILKNYDGGVYSVSFSRNRIFASAGWDNTIKLWRTDDRNSKLLLKTLNGHTSIIAAVSFSRNGKILASASADKTIKLWNVANGNLIRTFAEHNDGVTSVSFNRNGKIFASASADKTIKLWNVAKGNLIRTLAGHNDGVTSVSFSRNGKTLASGSYDNTVKLWNLNGKLLKTLKGHGLAIASVTFSPDGKTLASASWDNTIKLWRVPDGTLLRTLTGHNDGVTSVSFNPDSQILASGSADNTIKLWNLVDGTLLKTLNGYAGKVNSVSFSPDGKQLIGASEDTGVILWNLDIDDLLKRGCDRLHDYLKTNTNVKESDRAICASKAT
ncbi:MAG: caspase family protein [Aphanothece sp. CMT-3BRIN-NPC111]|jgi:WD40 repeat protein/uncharacterized caspase-like protein|nr:caspase family protein [Aphanothece sp. CMT-3BRIN-NPC111]